MGQEAPFTGSKKMYSYFLIHFFKKLQIYLRNLATLWPRRIGMILRSIQISSYIKYYERIGWKICMKFLNLFFYSLTNLQKRLFIIIIYFYYYYILLL